MKKNILKSLDDLSVEDNYSLALMLLYKVSDNPRYSVLSELSYLLDKDSLLRFLTYFGGKTIEVPTIERLKSTLRTLLLYQKYEIEKAPWSEALEFAGYAPKEGREAERYLTHFKRILNTVKLKGQSDDG
jgi:hypothetical protein